MAEADLPALDNGHPHEPVGQERAGAARVVLLIVGALAATLLIVIGVISLVGRGSDEPSLVGTKVAAFHAPRVGGGTVRSPWLDRHASVLVFFAKWCAPCRDELPRLAASAGSGRFGNVQVIGVDGDHSSSAAAGFVTDSEVRFPVAQDPSLAISSPLVAAYPVAISVSSSGSVTAVHYGTITASQLRRAISALG